jgi:hypothetical protein
MLRRRGEPDIALVESTARLAAPSWRPDGSLLTFQRQTDTGNTLEMVILSEPVLVRPIEVAEKLVTAPVSWRDRMHMLYTADGSIRTRGFEDRRSRPLNFRARVKAPEAPPPRQIVRRELEVADAPDGRLVIRAARLFDGIWKGYRENMDVVIEHGRIVAVEARRARDDGTVLDLGNVTVMPGLVDARSRLPGSLAAGTAVLAYGVTTIAVARSDPDYDPARWESETTPGPRLVFVDEPASPADFVSIADAATPGISGLLESRQAKAFHQIDRPPRRFSMPPDLTATAGPIIAVSQPNGLAPGIGLHAELRALQAAGLNGEQVLHAAGKNAAVVLGVENQVGTIIPGALADLLLVSGDPLDSVSAALNIVAIVRNGRFFSAVNLLERAASGAIVE